MRQGKTCTQQNARWHDCARRSTMLIVASIVMSALCCSGCASSRKAQKTITQLSEQIAHLRETQRSIDRRLSAMQTDSIAQRSAVAIDRRLDADEEVVATTEEFDTSQPTDTLTGTPPLKSRRTETRRRISHEQEQIAATSDLQGSTVQTLEAQSAEQTEESERTDRSTETETKQRFGMTWAQRTLCNIGIVVLAGAILWLVARILKRHL